MKRVGFIGLGNMGKGMCKNLIEAGNDITAFDVNRTALERFEGRAVLAADEMEVLENSDYIFFSLPNSNVVESLVSRFLEKGMKGKILVDTSTSYPPSTRRLAKAIKEIGGGMVDSPLLAGPAEAESGELLLVVGGDPEDVAKVDDLLAAISKSYKHVGPSGNGHLMKLAVNFCSLNEALIFAQLYPVMAKCGISPETVYDCLNNDIFDNWIFRFYSEKYVQENYRLDFAMQLGLKDLTYMKRLYEEMNIPGFLLDGALDLCRATMKEQKEGEVLDFSHAARTMYEFLGLR
ncbi:MAG: NAD(P)-dependent oxidoreductase [Clostridiales bacterium]|nr:NAD(P)-dependent oxidoreductase [Clostridiales bacterium]